MHTCIATVYVLWLPGLDGRCRRTLFSALADMLAFQATLASQREELVSVVRGSPRHSQVCLFSWYALVLCLKRVSSVRRATDWAAPPRCAWSLKRFCKPWLTMTRTWAETCLLTSQATSMLTRVRACVRGMGSSSRRFLLSGAQCRLPCKPRCRFWRKRPPPAGFKQR
jgi:hypothetical protein